MIEQANMFPVNLYREVVFRSGQYQVTLSADEFSLRVDF